MGDIEVLTIEAGIEKNVSSDNVNGEALEAAHIEKNVSLDKVDSEVLDSAHVNLSINDPVSNNGKTEESADIGVKNDKTLKEKVKRQKRRRKFTKEGDNNEVVKVMKSSPLEKMVDVSAMASPVKIESEALESVHMNLSVKDPVAVDGNQTEEIADMDVKNDNTLEARIKKPKKRRKVTKQRDNNEVVKVMKSNSLEKMVDGSGMIFMCNSKTKKDCYRYKVLGLPASKKNIVSKISKGMQLFLYDFDLKLLYGIYKATTEGGDNIVPKAFNSSYPSQVRFSVLEDCLPLAEENFKAAIKENYFRRSRFDCQLSPDQVKKLCKLFRSSTNGFKSNTLGCRSVNFHDTRRFGRGKHYCKGFLGRTQVKARGNPGRNRFLTRDRVARSYREEPSPRVVQTARSPLPYSYERPLPMDFYSGHETSYLDLSPRVEYGHEPYSRRVGVELSDPYGRRVQIGVERDDQYDQRVERGDPYGQRVGCGDPHGQRVQVGVERGDLYGQRVQVGVERGDAYSQRVERGDPYGQRVQIGVEGGDPYGPRVQLGGEPYSGGCSYEVFSLHCNQSYSGAVPLEYGSHLSPEPRARVYY